MKYNSIYKVFSIKYNLIILNRPGIKSGEGVIREISAYLLDSRNTKFRGFAGVPPTTLTVILHPSFKFCIHIRHYIYIYIYI